MQLEEHILRHGPMKEPEVSGTMSKKICEMVDNSGLSWSLESKTLVRLQITLGGLKCLFSIQGQQRYQREQVTSFLKEILTKL